jgi:hypothetical protein
MRLACRFMVLASRDFSFMPPTSYFLSNVKENAIKLFFFSPLAFFLRLFFIGREKKRVLSRFSSHLREHRRSVA